MRPFTVTRVVDCPRERVFDYLADLANHAQFTDHFLTDFRLERIDSRGVGAAARYRIAFPLGSLWAEAVITGLEPLYRIVIEGSAGRLGRIRTKTEYTLTLHDQDMTRVELTYSTEPATAVDRLKEALGMRPWLRSRYVTALRRLRDVLEQGQPATGVAGVAAG